MPFSQAVVPQRVMISEIYRDNAQNILEKTAVSNMIGLLQQMNQLSLYASEIFGDIFNETDKNAKRIENVKSRIANIEQQVPKVEAMFSENAPSYFYDHPFTQREWQRRDPLHGLIFRRDRAGNQVNRRRDFAQGAPDFSMMDQFSASGPCSKNYSDPNFFMNEWLDAEKRKMEEEKEKRKQRKERKKKKTKREVKKTILKVEKKRYNALGVEFDDPSKPQAQSGEVLVKQYTLTDENAAGAQVFDAASPAHGSAAVDNVPQMSRKSEKMTLDVGGGGASSIPIHAHPGPQASYMNASDGNNGSGNKLDQLKQLSPVILSNENGPPPAAFAGMDVGAAPVPPPAPNGNGPPPAPMPGQPPMPPIPNQGYAQGPPPIAMQPKRPLTGAEMAARSAQMAGDYRPPAPVMAAMQPKEPQKPKVIMPMRSNDFLSQIRGGAKLKKTDDVKREKPVDSRSMLLANLRKGATLKHVDASAKAEKKEEEVDRTVHAILQRRAFLEDDDSDEESDESWGSEDD